METVSSSLSASLETCLENKAAVTIQRSYKWQSLIKGIIISPSAYQTKEWRSGKRWYFNGKSNECEKYQKNIIEKITNAKLAKTHLRFNTETFELIEKMYPMKEIDGFDWTENFDGMNIYEDNTLYFNLKFICDSGGAQTRSLREVYHFIKCQVKYIMNKSSKSVYFINILDGDTCHRHIDYFKNIFKLGVVQDYIFIGDLYTFKKWYKKRF